MSKEGTLSGDREGNVGKGCIDNGGNDIPVDPCISYSSGESVAVVSGEFVSLGTAGRAVLTTIKFAGNVLGVVARPDRHAGARVSLFRTMPASSSTTTDSYTQLAKRTLARARRAAAALLAELPGVRVCEVLKVRGGCGAVRCQSGNHSCGLSPPRHHPRSR